SYVSEKPPHETLLPPPVALTLPVRHSQLLKLPNSKSRLGGQRVPCELAARKPKQKKSVGNAPKRPRICIAECITHYPNVSKISQPRKSYFIRIFLINID